MKRKINMALSVLLVLMFAITSFGLTTINITGIKLNTASVKIAVGKTYKLKLTFTPANATNKKVTFSSANKSVATVSSTGYIKGINPGKTAITVTSVSNKKAVAKCNVTIYKEPPMKLSIWTWFGFTDAFVKKTPVIKKMEEKLNVTFDLQGAHQSDSAFLDKLNLLLASNQLPDIVGWVWGATPKVKEVVTKFSLDEFKQYMPMEYKIIKELCDSNGISQQTMIKCASADDGKTMSLVQTCWPDGPYNASMGIRKDILDELGMPIPKTIDDWSNICKAFKKKYPDKYPINAAARFSTNLSYRVFDGFINSCGVRPFDWNLIGGKLVPGWTQPQVKDSLKFLAEWYKAGYINPEWVTFKEDDTYYNAMTSNKQIYIPSYCAAINDLVKPQPQFYAAKLYAAEPNAKIDLVPFPVLKAGVKPSIFVYNPVIAGMGAGFGNKLANDRDKLHKVMGVFDRILNDPEIVLLSNFGFEGEHYKMVDGRPVRIAPYDQFPEQEKVGIGEYWVEMRAYSKISQDWRRDPLWWPAYMKYYKEPGAIYGSDKCEAQKLLLPNALKSASGEDLGQKYQTNLITKRDEMFIDIITGKKPISEFDNFVEYWNNNGGKELEEAQNRVNLGFNQ